MTFLIFFILIQSVAPKLAEKRRLLVDQKITSLVNRNPSFVQMLTPLNQFQKVNDNREYSISFEWIWEIMYHWTENNYERFEDAAFFRFISAFAWKDVINS